MYYIQAAPFVSFLLVTFRILQRWIIEFKVARGEDVYDPAHPERNTPESIYPCKCRYAGKGIQ